MTVIGDVVSDVTTRACRYTEPSKAAAPDKNRTHLPNLGLPVELEHLSEVFKESMANGAGRHLNEAWKTVSN